MISVDRKIEAAANHKANLVSSLRRRMEAARSSNDSKLVGMLEQEMKQLGVSF